MDSQAISPDAAIIGIISAAVLAGLKAFAPTVQKQVPGFLWPIAVFFLARVGSAVCTAIGAGCSGNPLGWSIADTNLLAAAFTGVVAREVAVWGKGYTGKITDWINKLENKT